MTAEQLQPDDLPMSDDAKRAMALTLISDEIAYSPPFGGALHVWRWVKEQIVAASTAPTATSPENSTGTWGPCGFCGGTYLTGHRETCVLIVAASPAATPTDTAQLREADTEQFEQVMTALVTAVIDHQSSQGHTWNHFVPDCPQVIAARVALLSLFTKQQEKVKQEQYTNQRMCDTQLMMQEQHAAELSALAALTPRKAAGAPTRADGETVEGAVESFRPGTDDLAHLADLRVHAICDSSPGWPVGTKVTVSRLVALTPVGTGEDGQ